MAAAVALPRAVCAQLILALSFDGRVEHLPLLTLLSRGSVAAAGPMAATHALPVPQKVWPERILPLPPEPEGRPRDPLAT